MIRSTVVCLGLAAATASFAADAPARPAGSRRATRTRASCWTSRRASVPRARPGRASTDTTTRSSISRPAATSASAPRSRRPSGRSRRRRGRRRTPPVRQDLEILIDSAKRNLEGNALNERLVVPYFDAPQVVFFGVRGLLDDQVAPERRRRRSSALRKYVGPGGRPKPILELAAERTRKGLATPGPAAAGEDRDREEPRQRRASTWTASRSSSRSTGSPATKRPRPASRPS